MKLAELITSIVSLILAMSFHEWAHAVTAFRLGDRTAQLEGRLTLNPLAHIDPVGTVLLPVLMYLTTGFIFAAAKPVPIDFRSLSHPRRDMILIGASGPVANILLALAASLIMRAIPLPGSVSYFLAHLIVINVVLGLFNLIPLPPLDGSRIVTGLLPREAARLYLRIEPYGFFIVMLLFIVGGLGRILWPVVDALVRLLGVTI